MSIGFLVAESYSNVYHKILSVYRLHERRVVIYIIIKYGMKLTNDP